jgi:hypothetical protein
MADLNAHEAGNGGKSQRKPKAQSGLLYSANSDAGADPLPCRGRRKAMEEMSEQFFIVPAGISDDDMHAQERNG